jgi:hypothetical protein
MPACLNEEKIEDIIAASHTAAVSQVSQISQVK